MGKLEGKTCLITGGAGSLGAAAARLFVEHGAAVVLVDRDADGLDRVVRTLPPERTASMAGDVTDTEVASAYVALTLDRFGGIDVLFSNAGNFGTVKPIADYPDDVFDSVHGRPREGCLSRGEACRRRICARAARSSSRRALPACAATPAFMRTSPQNTPRSG